MSYSHVLACFILVFSATIIHFFTIFLVSVFDLTCYLSWSTWHLISVLIWGPNKWDSLGKRCAVVDHYINATSSDETEHSGRLNERRQRRGTDIDRLSFWLTSNCKNHSNNGVDCNRRSQCVRVFVHALPHSCVCVSCIFAGLHK